MPIQPDEINGYFEFDVHAFDEDQDVIELEDVWCSHRNGLILTVEGQHPDWLQGAVTPVFEKLVDGRSRLKVKFSIDRLKRPTEVTQYTVVCRGNDGKNGSVEASFPLNFVIPVFPLQADRWYSSAPALAEYSADWPIAAQTKGLYASTGAMVARTAAKKLHILGGSWDGAFRNYHLVYDPVANQWIDDPTLYASLPATWHSMAAVSYTNTSGEEEIWLAGGTKGGLANPSVWKWNPTTNLWTEVIANLGDDPSITLGILRDGRYFHLVGGASGSTGEQVHRIIDCETASLVTPVQLWPYVTFGHAGCSFDADTIQIAGGQASGSSYLNNHYRYTRSTNSYTALHTMPTPRVYVGGGRIGARFFVGGGYNGGYNSLFHSWEDPAGWTARPSLPRPAYAYNTAAVLDGLLYVFAGTDGTQARGELHAYVPPEGGNRPYF